MSRESFKQSGENKIVSDQVLARSMAERENSYHNLADKFPGSGIKNVINRIGEWSSEKMAKKGIEITVKDVPTDIKAKLVGALSFLPGDFAIKSMDSVQKVIVSNSPRENITTYDFSSVGGPVTNISERYTERHHVIVKKTKDGTINIETYREDIQGGVIGNLR